MQANRGLGNLLIWLAIVLLGVPSIFVTWGIVAALLALVIWLGLTIVGAGVSFAACFGIALLVLIGLHALGALLGYSVR